MLTLSITQLNSQTLQNVINNKTAVSALHRLWNISSNINKRSRKAYLRQFKKTKILIAYGRFVAQQRLPTNILNGLENMQNCTSNKKAKLASYSAMQLNNNV